MSAGRRRDKIVFQRAGLTDDGYTEREDWDNPVTVATEWAAVFYGSGAERRQAAMEQGSQTATFEVPSNNATRSMSVKDRIVFNGASWDIERISLDTPKLGEIAFESTRAAT